MKSNLNPKIIDYLVNKDRLIEAGRIAEELNEADLSKNLYQSGVRKIKDLSEEYFYLSCDSLAERVADLLDLSKRYYIPISTMDLFPYQHEHKLDKCGRDYFRVLKPVFDEKGRKFVNPAMLLGEVISYLRYLTESTDYDYDYFEAVHFGRTDEVPYDIEQVFVRRPLNFFATKAGYGLDGFSVYSLSLAKERGYFLGDDPEWFFSLSELERECYKELIHTQKESIRKATNNTGDIRNYYINHFRERYNYYSHRYGKEYDLLTIKSRDLDNTWMHYFNLGIKMLREDFDRLIKQLELWTHPEIDLYPVGSFDYYIVMGQPEQAISQRIKCLDRFVKSPHLINPYGKTVSLGDLQTYIYYKNEEQFLMYFMKNAKLITTIAEGNKPPTHSETYSDKLYCFQLDELKNIPHPHPNDFSWVKEPDWFTKAGPNHINSFPTHSLDFHWHTKKGREKIIVRKNNFMNKWGMNR